MQNLFKKAAVFTDLHVGAKSNSVVHNNDCINFIEWFITKAKSEGCETCLFLGDWNHNRSSLNIQTLSYSLRGVELLSAAFDQVFLIPGNHDQYFRDNRHVHSLAWAKHLSNVTIVNDWLERDGVVIAPWLIGDDATTLKNKRGQYLFGHFEFPHFYMNAQVVMPDHDGVASNDVLAFQHVFSGHFHKRQSKGNISYIGNAFPHNFSDVDDDERGMMILEWGGEPQYHAWPDQPLFKVTTLSAVLKSPETVLKANTYMRTQLDVDISYEEASFLRETLVKDYGLREMSLIPMQNNNDVTMSAIDNSKFEGVDSIIISQLSSIDSNTYDKTLLLDIYNSL